MAKSFEVEELEPNCYKKEQGKLIVKSILDAHGIIAEEFHLALGISPERTVSSLNMAPSSGSNGIKDTDNLEVENEDEKAPQNKKKRKIEMDGSDTDLEEGEVSLHDTDTEPEDNPGEIVLPQGEMCAAEIRRAKNIEEKGKLWSGQEDHYLSMFNDI